MPSLRPIITVLALAPLTACTFTASDRESSEDTQAGKVAISASAGDSGRDIAVAVSGDKDRRGQPTFSEGAGGQAWMSTTDGALLMGIRHDSVLIAFSDSIRNAVKSEVDTSMKKDMAEENGALGKAIGGLVEGTVKAALTEVFEKERGFPISSLRDVRYEDGEIVFQYRDKPLVRPENIKNDNERMTRNFHPADAARFVGAVRARLNAH